MTLLSHFVRPLRRVLLLLPDQGRVWKINRFHNFASQYVRFAAVATVKNPPWITSPDVSSASPAFVRNLSVIGSLESSGIHTTNSLWLEPGIYTTRSLWLEHGIHTTSSLWSEQVVKVPAFPDSISEGDVKFTCKVGDSFAADDAVMEIETDKTSIPVAAPFAGTVTEILVKSGDTVKSGQDLFKMKPGSAPSAAPTGASAPAPSPPPPAAPTSSPPTPSPPPPSPPAPSFPSSPPQTPSPPSPPAPGAPPKPAGPPASPAGGAPPITGSRSETRVKMSRMRLKIAQRLKEAQNTCAMLTTFNAIDMSFAMQFRKANLDNFVKQHGVKLGFMSIFSRASTVALQDQPVVNAVIDGKEIIYRDYVDISVAVASPRGLVVPIIRGVEGMKYAEIERTLAVLADKAKTDTITVEDMTGGTFTISNGGVFGSLMGTPIINPPQSAILGMHGIEERPIALKGQVVIRPMMYVALTYDHRIIDGREAVLFLRKIKAFVESPEDLATGL